MNPHVDDETRRELIFDGALIVNNVCNSSRELCEFAKNLVVEAFGDDPESSQFTMPVESFVKIASPLKSHFTNDEKTAELIINILKEFGCDLDNTFFDVPRLRIVSHDGYLSSGVGYAYKAHRDTWYSSPQSQVNWWVPVFDAPPSRTMGIYTQWWGESFPNSSEDFNYDHWCNVERKSAVNQIYVDTRKHPLPKGELNDDAELRIGLKTGELLQFSAAHLHRTVPNSSGLTRFSIDFRTVHLEDIENSNGAQNVDNKAIGTTFGDFRKASDLSPVPQMLVDKLKGVK